MKVTLRQAEVLMHVKECGVIGSGYEGSVLRSLRDRKLVIQHYNNSPSGVYYTWTLSADGKRFLDQDSHVIE